MKQVWIVNQYSVTPEYPASTRHYEFAKYLARHYKITLWGSNFIHHNKRYRFSKWTIRKREWLDGFCLIWLGAVPYQDNGVFRIVNMLLFGLSFFFAGLVCKERPQVIIGSSPSMFTAFFSMMLAKLKKAGFILEVRDLWPDSLIEITGENHTFIVKVLRYMEGVMYRKSDRIVVLTQGILQRLQERGISADKLLFLPNGMDLQNSGITINSRSTRDNLRNTLGFSDHDMIFMYAGAHGPANGLTQLIDAAEDLREDRRIKIVCMGEGVEKPKLQQMVRDRGLENIVKFLPAVPKSQVYEYLSCADAFLICLKDVPLFEGALPNKLFDYLLHDKPIITTVRGELQDFLQKNQLGLYGNIQASGDEYLPTVIRRIANDEFELPACAGREIVHRFFSREKQAEQLANVLEEVLTIREKGL